MKAIVTLFGVLAINSAAYAFDCAKDLRERAGLSTYNARIFCAENPTQEQIGCMIDLHEQAGVSGYNAMTFCPSNPGAASCVVSKVQSGMTTYNALINCSGQ